MEEMRNGASISEETIIPPMLYLPIRVGIAGEQSVEVRAQRDGRRALLAFTALDRLARECGREQPWALVQTETLGNIKDEFPFDVVSFDPVIDPQLTHGGKLR